jgi:hypothetical protein
MTKSTRAILATYASLLGRDSAAMATLREYDAAVAAGRSPAIFKGNNGFTVKLDQPTRRKSA